MALQHRAMVLAADWAQVHKELHVAGGAEEARMNEAATRMTSFTRRRKAPGL